MNRTRHGPGFQDFSGTQSIVTKTGYFLQEDHHNGEQHYASTPSSPGGAEEERKDV